MHDISHYTPAEQDRIRRRAKDMTTVAAVHRRGTIFAHPYGSEYEVAIGRPGREPDYRISVHDLESATHVAALINLIAEQDEAKWLECAEHDAILDDEVDSEAAYNRRALVRD